MILEELHLGITRNCTLYCEHCLRGDKECVNMSLDTLDNLFKDIKGIKTLLLTGGEPLLAINQLERLVQIIRSKNINVNVIRMITNGTVMSARVLRVLKALSELTCLDIKVSADIFHILELERLGFMELRNRNFEILEKCLGASWYGEETIDSKYIHKQLLTYRGRTKTLTKERLAEINDMIACGYVTTEDYGIPIREGKSLSVCDDTILGTMTVDVHGNLVGYGLEFVEEDSEAQEYAFNVNRMSLREAAEKYIEVQDRKKEEKESALLKKKK